MSVPAPASPAGFLRRWGVWVALVVAAVAVLAVGATARGRPSLEQRTMSLAGQVRCPVCEGQSAAQSDAPASIEIRDQIHQELAAGEPPARVLARLVGSYGPSILEKPPARGVSEVVWVAPVVAFVVAAGGLALAFARWRPRRATAVSSEDRALVARAFQDGGSGGPP